MKKNDIISVLAALLIFLWMYTAVSKLANLEEFGSQLQNQVFNKRQVRILFYLIPSSEISAALLLSFNKTRLYGFITSLVLMLAFTVYIALILLNYYDHVPCSCGGVLRLLGWKSHFIVNLVFLAIAGTGTLLNFKERRQESGDL